MTRFWVYIIASRKNGTLYVGVMRNPGHRGQSVRVIAGSLSGTSRAVCPGHCGQPVNSGDQHLWVI
jgi:hypothetical protein